MSSRLFVGGLSWDSTEESLKTFFSQISEPTSVKIITDKYSGRSKGFGFVEMSSEEDAKRAIEELNGKELDGRTVVVNEAKPQAPREDRGGRPGRGRDDRGGRNW